MAFAVTLVFRVVTARFGNDHFTHLSRARQIVLGEWPIRDFFDPGQFLHYYMSAAAQLAFGYNLYGEAVLTSAFIALGAGLTYGAGARMSRSPLLGACAACLSVVAFPRLYNYPKVFLYVAAMWLAWWYAQAPGRVRAATLAAFTVLAFLFRYDHGAYIGGTVVVLLAAVHLGRGRDWRTATATYVGGCCLLLVPFAAYVQWAAGLPQYVEASAQSAGTVSRVARRALGVRIALDMPTPARAGGSAALAAPLETMADVLTERNAEAWFTLITLVLPLVALVVGAWGWARGAVSRYEGAAVVASACMCIVITRTLLEANPGPRLADVVSPVAVLGAWLAGRFLGVSGSRSHGLVRHVAVRAVIVSVFAVTLWSIATQARFDGRLRDADLHNGPAAAWRQAKRMYARLHLRPIDDWARGTSQRGIEGLAYYILRCTAPADRLLVAGEFAPDVYFYAERGFAGGQVHFMPGWHDAAADQQLTIERLEQQSVPVVLLGGDEERFRRRFSGVAAYLDDHYTATSFRADGERQWRVLVDRDRVASGTDHELELPCYAAPASTSASLPVVIGARGRADK